jgi:hypothetical protein
MSVVAVLDVLSLAGALGGWPSVTEAQASIAAN